MANYGHCAKECYSNKCFSYGKVRHYARDYRSENKREEMINLLIEDVEVLLMMERFEIGLSSGTVHTEIGSLDDQYCKGNDKDCGVATRA